MLPPLALFASLLRPLVLIASLMPPLALLTAAIPHPLLFASTPLDIVRGCEMGSRFEMHANTGIKRRSTGDIGEWQPNGAMKIIDRKKNIFKLSQGKYIAVENLENTYNRCPIIDSWDKSKLECFESFLVAVVVPNKTALEDWAETHDKSGDYQSLCISPRARKYILDELNSTGKKHKLRGFEMLKAIHLEPNPFNSERDLITPTFKLKRPQLLKYYEEYIDQLYNEAKGGATIARGVLYEVNNGSETELLYFISDPLLIRDGLETEYNNFVSDPLLIRDGSETEYNNYVSDPLLIRDGSETESNNFVSDPLLIRDGSKTEYNNSISDPLLIRDGSETDCNYNCTL
ncbi:hypothetical protein Syun_018781 [Stephania yunnanensis]|uniref:Uncharacterized protein n=1 Tax=Stephania yunnanensis TaxID=152371 RepID=A0AAP0NWP2_9MAGN